MTITTLILAIDIGSSSIRCSAYHYNSTRQKLAKSIITKSYQLQSVEPGPRGRVRVLDVVKYVNIDEVLQQ